MRVLRRIVLGLSVLAVAAAATLWCLYHASQTVPEFYEQALHIEPQAARVSGDQLEKRVLNLHNDLRSGTDWELELSDEQVNGWIASDLNEKFPQLLPREVKEPRVAFDDEGARIACRIESKNMTTVLSVKLIAYLTDQPNEIAVRIQRVRAGVLPLPLAKILDQISTAAAKSGLHVRWSQEQGDPVAIVRIPTDHRDLRRGVELQTIDTGPGLLRVAGIADADQPRVADSLPETMNRQH